MIDLQKSNAYDVAKATLKAEYTWVDDVWMADVTSTWLQGERKKCGEEFDSMNTVF